MTTATEIKSQRTAAPLRHARHDCYRHDDAEESEKSDRAALTWRCAGSDRNDKPDYRYWSVEELRAFATQLQLPDAARKSRGELLGIFDVSAR